ncbi:MAG TPA: peptide ABC transporter substrate-binding protein [Xanthomonadales bacterium]|nr:peptide ABC transporter substrate-binding protein [Xanthomonadales bacterium]
MFNFAKRPLVGTALKQLLTMLLFCLGLLLPQLLQAETLRRGLGPEPDSLHIHRAQGLAAVNLLRDLREGLVTFDVNGEPAPGVASGWEVLEGGLLYRFTLRPDARWSDGSAVTPKDFVRGWTQALAPATAAVNAALLKDVRNAQGILNGEVAVSELGIKITSPQQLEVRLERPVPWFPELLAHPVSYPLHENDGEDARSAPVNGAYQIAEWLPRSVIRLQANPHFHANAEVHFKELEYFPIEEASTELARYRAGELDITETIPAGRFEWLRENLPNDLRISPYLGSFWLGLNMKDPLVGGSLELRRALALAIDRATLVRVVLGAGELPAWGVVPPGMPGYQPQAMPLAEATQEQREAEARRLLKASGIDAGRALLQLRYNTSGVHRRVAIAVSAMWKQVLGLNTELINEEWKVFVNNRRLGIVTQVFRGGWIADYADATSFLEQFESGSELNVTFSHDPAFDQALAAASLMSGPGRMQQLQDAENRLLEFLPVIPLYYYVSRHLVKPGIDSYEDNIRDIHLSRYLRPAGSESSP